MGFSMKSNLNLDDVEGSRFTVKVVVGYSDSDMHRSGLSMSELAAIMTYGTYTIPARPHLEEGLFYGQTAIRAAMKRYLSENRRRRNPSELGETMVEAVKDYVYSGELEPNAPSTVRKKKSAQPLVEMGDLLRHLTYIVVRGPT